MSYLVEQTSCCDLLRLSLVTRRFVRFRRTHRARWRGRCRRRGRRRRPVLGPGNGRLRLCLAIRFVSLPNSPPTSGRPAGASPRLSLVVLTVQAVRLDLSRWPTPAPATAYVRKPSLRSVSLQGPLQRRFPPFCPALSRRRYRHRRPTSRRDLARKMSKCLLFSLISLCVFRLSACETARLPPPAGRLALLPGSRS